jgi:protease I
MRARSIAVPTGAARVVPDLLHSGAEESRMAKIVMPVGEGFEDSEFSEPCERLKEAGHEVVTIGVERDARFWGKRGKTMVTIDRAAEEIDANEVDALVIPGGHSPDELRTHAGIVALIRRVAENNKPVAAICHGPQLLIEAELVEGREVTSWPSVRKDLENAGARWVDRAVVEDGNIITSRKPDDLDAFCQAILNRLPVTVRRPQTQRSEPQGMVG